MEKHFRGTPNDPTANSDVRHEFALTANTPHQLVLQVQTMTLQKTNLLEIPLSFLNFQMQLEHLQRVRITDFDGVSATVKSASNTTTLVDRVR